MHIDNIIEIHLEKKKYKKKKEISKTFRSPFVRISVMYKD